MCPYQSTGMSPRLIKAPQHLSSFSGAATGRFRSKVLPYKAQAQVHILRFPKPRYKIGLLIWKSSQLRPCIRSMKKFIVLSLAKLRQQGHI